MGQPIAFRTPDGAPGEVSCHELIELITDYLEGKLREHDLRRFEAHLAACPPCQIYLAQMRQTIRVLGTLSEDAVPAQQMDTLMAAFRDWKSAALGSTPA